MDKCPDSREYELFCVIVNHGVGSKIIKFAKQHGISGATVILGKGTIKNHWLEALEFFEIRREIVFVVAEKELGYSVMNEIEKKFDLKKPNHGIAFTFSLNNFLGARYCIFTKKVKREIGEKIMYNAVFVVVDKGQAESVIEAANSAGSRGGTIINARGSGIHETETLFSMAIEPEKEIVFIISKSDLTDPIVNKIREELKIDEPGKGIIFVLDVNKTYGLFNTK